MLRFIVLGAFSSEGKCLIEGVPPGAHYFLTNYQPVLIEPQLKFKTLQIKCQQQQVFLVSLPSKEEGAYSRGGGGEGAYQSERGYSRKYGYMQCRAILFSRRFQVALFSRKQMKSVGAKIRQRISVEKYLYLCLQKMCSLYLSF